MEGSNAVRDTRHTLSGKFYRTDNHKQKKIPGSYYLRRAQEEALTDAGVAIEKVMPRARHTNAQVVGRRKAHRGLHTATQTSSTMLQHKGISANTGAGLSCEFYGLKRAKRAKIETHAHRSTTAPLSGWSGGRYPHMSGSEGPYHERGRQTVIGGVAKSTEQQTTQFSLWIMRMCRANQQKAKPQ